MAGNGLDLQKLFAMQAQLKKEMKPLKGIEKEKISIRYITLDGKVDTRKIILYTPKNAAKPLPLVYVPHYEMKEYAL